MTDLDITDHLKGPILLVGAGKMGGSLLAGWLESGVDPAQIYVQDPNPASAMLDLLSKYDIQASDDPQIDGHAAVIMLAVKPQIVQNVLPSLTRFVGSDTLVISIMAGCQLSVLQTAFGEHVSIVRAMPNTPSAIGQGITALCATDQIDDSHKILANALLSAVGKTIWLDTESDMDAVTAISGSGPAYVFLLTEVLAKAGHAAGLDPDLASELARQTVCGSGALMATSSLPPSVLRENVTSPGGTTQAALDVLMRDPEGLQSIITEAVLQAQKRSRELS